MKFSAITFKNADSLEQSMKHRKQSYENKIQGYFAWKIDSFENNIIY